MDNRELWPGWETVRLIGRGSFGAVYEIQRDVFGDVEKAALKVISIPQNASDIDEMYSDGYDEESITATFQAYLQSIVAEYSLMRKMSGSANIVNCDDIRYVQRDGGIGWDVSIKMELLTPLPKALPTEVSEETAIKIAGDICAALELCKKHGIVHRDIKPQNIFVSPNGDYKLGDFGIAKTIEKTMGGTKIGTYKYMAPEVYNNEPYGSAADIYSLGLVLYWLLNDRRMPFVPLPPVKQSAVMEAEARNRRLSGEPLPSPAYGSRELKSIVSKACSYDPINRYCNASEMRMDLLRIGWKHLETNREMPVMGEHKTDSIKIGVSEELEKNTQLTIEHKSAKESDAERQDESWKKSEAAHREWLNQQNTSKNNNATRAKKTEKMDHSTILKFFQTREKHGALQNHLTDEMEEYRLAHNHWSGTTTEHSYQNGAVANANLEEIPDWKRSEAAHREWLESLER